MGAKKVRLGTDRIIAEEQFERMDCRLCASYAGVSMKTHYCKEKKCPYDDFVGDAVNISAHDMKSQTFENKTDTRSFCTDCPYGNPTKPCVSFCMKKILMENRKRKEVRKHAEEL